MKKSLILMLVIGLLLGLNVGAGAVTLTFDGTIITGINDLFVLGQTYNVKFTDGSHAGLMSTIDDGVLRLDGSSPNWDNFRDALQEVLEGRAENVWVENKWNIRGSTFKLYMFDGIAHVPTVDVPALAYFPDYNTSLWLKFTEQGISPYSTTEWDTRFEWAVWSLADGQSTPVPEPSTLFLLGAGLAGLGFYRRKKMQS